jgi:hypothetical protein
MAQKFPALAKYSSGDGCAGAGGFAEAVDSPSNSGVTKKTLAWLSPQINEK